MQFLTHACYTDYEIKAIGSYHYVKTREMKTFMKWVLMVFSVLTIKGAK